MEKVERFGHWALSNHSQGHGIFLLYLDTKRSALSNGMKFRLCMCVHRIIIYKIYAYRDT